MKILKILYKNSFWLLLLAVVAASYGQMLWMQPWQDDNALFFKLAHIEEGAGYLGRGPLGEGAYKYTATPYIPIYHFFGYNTFAYFTYTFLFYFLASLSVWKVFTQIIGKDGGKVASILFAAGYVASDGFIRLYNSIVTSVSIILLSFILLFYWKFYKSLEYKWYILSVLFYLLCVELARARSHYLIAVIIAFELLFLSFKSIPRSLFTSLLRLVPYGLIFNYYFVLNADVRSGELGRYASEILNGNFYLVYSFFIAFINVTIPDWLTENLLQFPSLTSFMIFASFVSIVFTLIYACSLKTKILTGAASIFVIGITGLVTKYFFTAPVLNLSPYHYHLLFLASLTIVIFALGGLKLKGDQRKIYYLLLFWILVNIGGYAAYNPTVAYESINRYLAHSFFAVSGLFALTFSYSLKTKFRLLPLFILLWGAGNLTAAVIYQNNVLSNRSFPVKTFYDQLQQSVKDVKKGDTFYFDVEDQVRGQFADAFSVAQMPETTAIAWRYGIDRYDISLFTEFDKLAEAVKKGEISKDQIHYFFYSRNGLANVTDQSKLLLESKEEWQSEVSDSLNDSQSGNLEVPIKDYYPTLTPSRITLNLRATSLPTDKIKFPIQQENTVDPVYLDEEKRSLSFKYFREKGLIQENSHFFVSSEWQDRVVSNLFDNDLNSVWQADRVIWQKGEESLSIDLKRSMQIDRFVWVNGFANNTPTEFFVETSQNGNDWETVQHVNQILRIDNKDFQEVNLKGANARFVRMRIVKTLNNDSPAIAEAWIVPTSFQGLSLKSAEDFVSQPFKYIPNEGVYLSTLQEINNKGSLTFSWKTDKSTNLKSQAIEVTYDGSRREYAVNLPAGGTKIEKIVLSGFSVPATINLHSIKFETPGFDEINKSFK